MTAKLIGKSSPIWKWLLVLLVLSTLVLAATAYYLVATKEGSRFLLAQIADHQHMMSYTYQGGDFKNGLILKNIEVHGSKDYKITIDQAVMKVGWRALVKKELHFRQASLTGFHVKRLTPSAHKPFNFTALKLPFTLRFDHAVIHDLTIEPFQQAALYKKPTRLTDIMLNDAVWDSDVLSLTDSSLNAGIVSAQHVTGNIQFSGRYPIDATGQLRIPLLNTLNAGIQAASAHEFMALNTGQANPKKSLKQTKPSNDAPDVQMLQIKASGTVDTLHIDSDLTLPDRAHASITAHPVREGVPFSGQVSWQQFRWPVMTSERLRSSQGQAQFNGNIDGISVDLATDLQGQHLPYGHYAGQMSTDFKQLSIQHLQANTLGGQIEVLGQVNWQHKTAWDLRGRLTHIDIQQQLEKVPQSIRPYVPRLINGPFLTQGELASSTATVSKVGVYIKQVPFAEQHLAKPNFRQSNKQDTILNDGHETWVVGMGQRGSLGNAQSPVAYDARWRNVARQVAGIGALVSPQGQAKIGRFAGKTVAHVDLDLTGAALNPLNKPDVANPTTLEAVGAQLKQQLINQSNELKAQPIKAKHSNAKTAENNNTLAQSKPKQTLPKTVQAQKLPTQPVDKAKTLAPASLIPAGHYRADIVAAARTVDIPQFNYNGIAGQLNGTAHIEPGQNTQTPTRWQATLLTTGLNPQRMTPAAPFNQVTGHVVAHGEITPSQYTFTLTDTYLEGILPATAATKTQKAGAARPMVLKGTGQAAILMQPANAAKQPLPDKTVAMQTPVKQTPGQGSQMRSFAAQFNGQFNTAGIPGGQLTVDIAGTPQLIQVRKFTHSGDTGKINAQGEVNLTQGIGWQGQAALEHFNPAFFVAGWPGDLSGTLHTHGQWQTHQHEIHVNQLNMQGTLRHEPIRAQGALDIVFGSFSRQGLAHDVLTSQINAQNLLLAWAGNELTANGHLQNLHLQINAPQLGRIHPHLAGHITGQIETHGISQKPDATVNLQAEHIRFNTLTIEHATVQGQIKQLGEAPSQLSVDIANIGQDKQVISSVKGLLSGTRANHRLAASVATPSVQADMILTGSLQPNYDWQGQLADGHVVTRVMKLAQATPARMTWQNATGQLTLTPHCWTDVRQSELCLTEPLLASRNQAQTALALKHLDLSMLENMLPQGLSWQGAVNGQAKLAWQAGGTPQLNALLYTDQGSFKLAPDDPQDEGLILPYQRLSLLAKTQADGLKVRFDVRTSNIGTGYVDAVINPNVTPKTINGAVVLDKVQLGVFKPFFPGMQILAGTASLAGGMSGPLTGPDFYGEFKLNDGRIMLASVPVSLSKINLKSSIRGSRANLEGRFASGDGEGQITGQAIWVGEPAVKLKITGQDLLIRQAPQLTARINPMINIDILPSRKQLNVAGTIDVPKATVSPDSNNDGAIALSPDVRIIDRRIKTVPRPIQVKAPWQIDAAINIKLGSEVFFQGFGANVPLSGSLQVSSRGAGHLTGQGHIHVPRSVRIDAFGQTLQLKHADVRFNGPLTQPLLDIEAAKTVSGRMVGVRIGGRMTNPAVVIINDAGLSEQEALNAMLTGRITANNTLTNTAGFKSEVNNTLAAAGLSAGLSGSRNFTNKLGRTFGLSGLTVDAEGVGNDTQVNVTGYISPDLYLRYGVGVFTPVNKLTLRYQVNKRLYVEASSAIEKAIDVFYNWRF